MNALIQRYRDSSMQPGQLWIYGVVYAAVVAILLFIAISSATKPGGFVDATYACRIVYYEMLVVEVIALWFWAAYNAGTAIPEEITQKSHDFFRLLPLSASEKIAGIAVGRNLVQLAIGAVTFVVMTLAGLVGGVSLGFQVQVLVLLASVAATLPLLALLSSLTKRKISTSSRNQGALGLVVLVFFVAPMVLGFIGRAEDSGSRALARASASFYGLKVLALPLVSVLAVSFAAWAYAGIRRRFTREREPLFTSRALVGFYVFLIAIAYGFAWEFLPKEVFLPLIVSLGTGITAVGVCGGRMLKFTDYVELRRADGLAGTGGDGWSWMSRRSNLAPWLLVLAIWAASSWYAMNLPGLGSPLVNLAFVAVAFTFLLFLCSVLELSALHSQSNPKMNFLLGFIVLLHVALPLIVAAVLDRSSIVNFSVLGYFGKALSTLGESNGEFPLMLPKYSAAVAVFNLALSGLAGMLIMRRYRAILRPSTDS